MKDARTVNTDNSNIIIVHSAQAANEEGVSLRHHEKYNKQLIAIVHFNLLMNNLHSIKQKEFPKCNTNKPGAHTK